MTPQIKRKPVCSIHPVLRCVLFFFGSLFLILGIIGIIIPILPTTPFLLLAAACYLRSSQRFYSWLLNHKWFGVIIKNYYEEKGLPLKFKVFMIILLWVTISISIFFFIESFWIRILLFIIAVLVSFHIGLIKTTKKTDSE